MRRGERGDGENHYTVGASLLDACGRGVLIATAGIVVGVLMGTAPPAAASLGLWMLGLSAAAGAGLLIGGAIVKNAGCARREDGPDGEPDRMAGVLTLLVHAVPGVPEAEAAEQTGQASGPHVERLRRRERQARSKGV